jgi:hypothetical protein
MTVINPNSEIITINYFNRLGNTPASVSIYDESTRITTVKDVINFLDGSYYDILIIENNGYFSEGKDYVISVRDISGNIVFLDKAFSTSQTNYSINNGIYTTNETDTEYIIYE